MNTIDAIQAYLYAAGLPPGKYTRAELRSLAKAAGLRTKAGRILPGRLTGEIPAANIRPRPQTVYVSRGDYATVGGRVEGTRNARVYVVGESRR